MRSGSRAPTYTNHYKIARKTPLGSLSVSSESYTSNDSDDDDGAKGDDETNGEDDAGLSEESSDKDSSQDEDKTIRASSEPFDENHTSREKGRSPPTSKRRSFRTRKPTDKLREATLLRNALRKFPALKTRDKTLRSDSSISEPFNPATKVIDLEDLTAEPSKVATETYDIVDDPLKPTTKFILVECGHHDSSKNKFGGNPDMYQVSGLHADHAAAIDTAEQRLKEIIEEPDWKGDYTVWLSPLNGPDKQKRVRLTYGQIRDRESALSELRKLPLWQEAHCTMVYMTSKDGKVRRFVKMTPFESRHF